MKKFLAIVSILIIFLVLCTGCSSAPDEKKVISAKVRYFDGSMDTLEINRFEVSVSGLVHLYLKDGADTYIGVNNVIIIKETEEQYTH